MLHHSTMIPIFFLHFHTQQVFPKISWLMLQTLELMLFGLIFPRIYSCMPFIFLVLSHGWELEKTSATFWPLLTKLWVLICSLTTNWLTINVGGFTCHSRWTSSVGFSFDLLGKVYEWNWINKMLMSQQCEEFVASFHWFWCQMFLCGKLNQIMCQILPKRSYQKLQAWLPHGYSNYGQLQIKQSGCEPWLVHCFGQGNLLLQCLSPPKWVPVEIVCKAWNSCWAHGIYSY